MSTSGAAYEPILEANDANAGKRSEEAARQGFEIMSDNHYDEWQEIAGKGLSSTGHLLDHFVEKVVGTNPDGNTHLLAVRLRPWGRQSEGTSEEEAAWTGPDMTALSQIAEVLAQGERIDGRDRHILVILSVNMVDGLTPAQSLHHHRPSLEALFEPGRPNKEPFLWPLYTKDNLEALHLVVSSAYDPGNRIKSMFRFLWGNSGQDRLREWLRHNLGPNHAYAYSYNLIYMRALWIQAGISVFFIALDANPDTETGSFVSRVLWEVYKIVLLCISIVNVLRSMNKDAIVPGTRIKDHATKPGRPGPGPLAQLLRDLFSWSIAILNMALQTFVIFECVQMSTWTDQELLTAGVAFRYSMKALRVILFCIALWVLASLRDFLASLPSKLCGSGDAIHKADREARQTMLLGFVGGLCPYVILALMFAPNFSEEGNCPPETGPLCDQYIIQLARHTELQVRRQYFWSTMALQFVLQHSMNILRGLFVPMVMLRARLFVRANYASGEPRGITGLSIRVLSWIFGVDVTQIRVTNVIERKHVLSEEEELNLLSGAWDQTFREKFDAGDEIQDVLLSMVFVNFFAPIVPVGVVVTAILHFIEAQCDLFQILFLRQRQWPKSGDHVHGLQIFAVAIAIVACVTWSAALSFITYGRG